MISDDTAGITRFVLALSVKPGAEEQFLAAWCQLAEAAARHPANLEQWLTRGADNTANTWYVTSDWLDPAAYAEFSNSAEHHELAAQMRLVTTGAALTRSEHVLHLSSPANATRQPAQPAGGTR